MILKLLFRLLLAWHIEFGKLKGLKKELIEELILIAWRPRKWQVV